MRILLTGAGGQFGQMFQEVCRGGRHEVLALGHRQLAVEDAAATRGLVEQVRPDWIVHAAAMTDVDACERQPDQAHAVNALGTENLARAAAAAGSRLLAISTDYVFDGTRGMYKESHAPHPLSVYGASKLEGEQRARAVLPKLTIARTAVVWGPHKGNFVTWVRDSLRAGKPLRIVRDQWVSPTHTHDLSQQVLALVEAGAEGLFHTAGRDRLSRLDMALAIARHEGLDATGITPIRMADLTWAARRPRDSSLDVGKVGAYADPQPFSAGLAWQVAA